MSERRYTQDELDEEFRRTYWSVAGEDPTEEEVIAARSDTLDDEDDDE